MKYIIGLLMIVTTTLGSFAQTFSSSDPAYIKNVEAGEKALKEAEYDSCLYYYQEAFKIKQTSVLSTLRGAACAYSLDDQKTLNAYLDTAFELNWEQTRSIFEQYNEFAYLYDTPFSERIYSTWKLKAEEAGINVALMNELMAIQESDQKQRQEMSKLYREGGMHPTKLDSLAKIQYVSDSLNLIRIEEIIATYGYPGKSLVGRAASSTAFLVIQHSNQEKQERYLPLLKAAADAGEIRWSSVALMIDRVRLGRGEKQLYGSQIITDRETGQQYFDEIENPFQIDSIRATVGLGPIQEYADRWNIKWDPNQHLERHKKQKEEK